MKLANTNGNLLKKGSLFCEIGCGVGNAFFPIMEVCDVTVKGVACDFSQRAVDFVRNHEQFEAERMTAFQCDIVQGRCGSSSNAKFSKAHFINISALAGMLL